MPSSPNRIHIFVLVDLDIEENATLSKHALRNPLKELQYVSFDLSNPDTPEAVRHFVGQTCVL